MTVTYRWTCTCTLSGSFLLLVSPECFPSFPLDSSSYLTSRRVFPLLSGRRREVTGGRKAAAALVVVVVVWGSRNSPAAAAAAAAAGVSLQYFSQRQEILQTAGETEKKETTHTHTPTLSPKNTAASVGDF